MLSCWDENPLARPSFRRARQHLDQVISTTEEAEEYLLLVSGELIDDNNFQVETEAGQIMSM